MCGLLKQIGMRLKRVVTICFILMATVCRGQLPVVYHDVQAAEVDDMSPRGINELMFSLSHIHADTLDVPLSSRLLIFRGGGPVKTHSFLRDTLSAIQTFSPYAHEPYVFERFVPSRSSKIADEMLYEYMISHPEKIQYLSWTLPDPPKLMPTEDKTGEFLMQDVFTAQVPETPVPVMLEDIKRTNWLQKLDAGVQFSQAYLSPNWYQGGTNNLSLLINFLWDVKLNEVYHPSLLFSSTLSYKLGLYSTPQDSLHKYSVSEDLFQYNLKFGIRAKRKWFYSVTAQFKTQFLNNYGENSRTRKAAFMSPGELNFGLGMTYASTSRKGKMKLNLSVAPLSYNLKTCIDELVDPTQFSIPAGTKSKSQVGSSAEGTMEWQMTSNISWRSRVFLFSNYDDFQGDWENTMNFSINRFLSTQIYAHLRFDTASEPSSGSWRHWMFKEILSFGFRYAFSTK